MNKFNLPNLGFGLGLRGTHYSHIIENKPDVDWFEIISENYMDSKGRPRALLEQVRADYPIVMHGVSLSIGSSDPLNETYLKNLKQLAHEIEPQWISDHLCWTGINGKNTHDLLPVPLTEEALQRIIPRIKQVQDYLGRNILLENPSSYLTYRADHIPEYEFLARMVEEADCGILLDVNNIYVASYNQRLDPHKYIDAIPPERVVQMHLAGHMNKGSHIVDTHDGHVIDEVWDLYKYAIGKLGFTPSTMIEWDAKIPEFPVLEAEINMAREFAGQVAVQNEYHNTEYEYQPSNHSVLDLQENLQGAILDGDIAAAAPDTWIIPKENFSPAEQLAVYVKGYRLSFYDTLADDYEVTKHYLGDNKMSALLREHIENIPSEFYNIESYSAGFCDWLKTQDVDVFACELAELERMIATCFNMQNNEALAREDLANIAPEDFVTLQLSLRDATILATFENDVNSYMSGFYNEEETNPENKKSHVLVYRNELKVFRLALDEDEHKLLNILASGKNIGEAMEELAQTSSMSEEELAEKIQEWFGKWVSNEILKKPESLAERAA